MHVIHGALCMSTNEVWYLCAHCILDLPTPVAASSCSTWGVSGAFYNKTLHNNFSKLQCYHFCEISHFSETPGIPWDICQSSWQTTVRQLSVQALQYRFLTVSLSSAISRSLEMSAVCIFLCETPETSRLWRLLECLKFNPISKVLIQLSMW